MASGLTTTYLLPYPLQTDPVDVASDAQDLAEAVETELLLKASLASPTFTGTPAAPTAASDTSTTQIATTQFVVNQGYLKVADASSTYAPLDSPTLSGTPTSPTASLGTNTTQIATTEYVQNELNNFVTLPDQTGANGYFLTSDGSNAAWQQIEIADVNNLQTTINNLDGFYSPLNLTVITDTSLSRTLSTSDAATIILRDYATSNGVIVPFESSQNFPVGTQIVIVQAGVGQTFIEGDSLLGGASVTVNGTPGLNLRDQWSSVTLIKIGSDEWVAMGDLSA